MRNCSFAFLFAQPLSELVVDYKSVLTRNVFLRYKLTSAESRPDRLWMLTVGFVEATDAFESLLERSALLKDIGHLSNANRRICWSIRDAGSKAVVGDLE
jgi:hypothetical protein